MSTWRCVVWNACRSHKMVSEGEHVASARSASVYSSPFGKVLLGLLPSTWGSNRASGATDICTAGQRATAMHSLHSSCLWNIVRIILMLKKQKGKWFHCISKLKAISGHSTTLQSPFQWPKILMKFMRYHISKTYYNISLLKVAKFDQMQVSVPNCHWH